MHELLKAYTVKKRRALAVGYSRYLRAAQPLSTSGNRVAPAVRDHRHHSRPSLHLDLLLNLLLNPLPGPDLVREVAREGREKSVSVTPMIEPRTQSAEVQRKDLQSLLPKLITGERMCGDM